MADIADLIVKTDDGFIVQGKVRIADEDLANDVYGALQDREPYPLPKAVAVDGIRYDRDGKESHISGNIYKARSSYAQPERPSFDVKLHLGYPAEWEEGPADVCLRLEVSNPLSVLSKKHYAGFAKKLYDKICSSLEIKEAVLSATRSETFRPARSPERAFHESASPL